MPTSTESPSSARFARWAGVVGGARLDLIALALLASCILGIGASSGSLRDWDEALYAEIARQYHEGGAWLSPIWNGAPWYDKPPLGMWLIALSYRLFGVGEGSVRLFSVVCGIGGVLATYGLARSLLGRSVALLAALILLSTPHWFWLGKMGMLDVPLTLFITLGLGAYWLGLTRPRWLLAAGLCFGLAFMIKGVAAGVMPLAALLHAVLHRRSDLLRSPWLWGGAAVACAVALPWHAYQLVTVGDQFWNEYFGYHVLTRALQSVESHHEGPFYYLGVLVRRQRPWFLLSLPAIAYAIVIAWRERRSDLSLVLCWVAAVAFIVTLVATRMEWYLLPIYPALSICIAFLLVRMVPARHFTALVVACVLVLGAHALASRTLFRGDYNPELKSLAPALRRSLAPEEVLYFQGVSPNAAIYYSRRQVRPLSPRIIEALGASPEGALHVLAIDDRFALRAGAPTAMESVAMMLGAGFETEVIAAANGRSLLRVVAATGTPNERGGDS